MKKADWPKVMQKASWAALYGWMACISVFALYCCLAWAFNHFHIQHLSHHCDMYGRGIPFLGQPNAWIPSKRFGDGRSPTSHQLWTTAGGKRGDLFHGHKSFHCMRVLFFFAGFQSLCWVLKCWWLLNKLAPVGLKKSFVFMYYLDCCWQYCWIVTRVGNNPLASQVFLFSHNISKPSVVWIFPLCLYWGYLLLACYYLLSSLLPLPWLKPRLLKPLFNVFLLLCTFSLTCWYLRWIITASVYLPPAHYNSFNWCKSLLTTWQDILKSGGISQARFIINMRKTITVVKNQRVNPSLHCLSTLPWIRVWS